MDTEEDDENLRGLFSNEIHFLDVQGGGLAWRKVELRKKKEEKVVEKIPESTQSVKTTTDGIFTVTVAGPKQEVASKTSESAGLDVGGPSPRMNAAIVMVRHNLWIFGGSYEQGSRQYTLCDFYSLDVNKCESWRTLIGNLPSLQWLGSDSEDSSDSGEEDDESDSEEESSDDDDMET